MGRFACLVAAFLLSASPVLARTHAGPEVGIGIASMYSRHFVGHTTASGAVLHRNSLTAAHRTLPFGTKLKVTNRRNGRSVIVTVNDRGPHLKGRIIDLSPAAAKKLGMVRAGLAPVVIRLAASR